VTVDAFGFVEVEIDDDLVFTYDFLLAKEHGAPPCSYSTILAFKTFFVKHL
jgi:hypothetical protein